jgi:hypothetical protein
VLGVECDSVALINAFQQVTARHVQFGFNAVRRASRRGFPQAHASPALFFLAVLDDAHFFIEVALFDIQFFAQSLA